MPTCPNCGLVVRNLSKHRRGGRCIALSIDRMLGPKREEHLYAVVALPPPGALLVEETWQRQLLYSAVWKGRDAREALREAQSRTGSTAYTVLRDDGKLWRRGKWTDPPKTETWPRTWV